MEANNESKDMIENKESESTSKESTEELVKERADSMSAGDHSSQSAKASTPVSTNKLINFSEVSVINKVPERQLKSRKSLYNRRKSVGFALLPPTNDCMPGPSTSTSTQSQLYSSDESLIKKNQMENSINKSIYLQTVFLSLKTKQMMAERKANAFHKCSQLFKQINQMRPQLLQLNKSVLSLQSVVESIDSLTKMKTTIEQYLAVRSKVNLIFDGLSELIRKPTVFSKIENCTENDFKILGQLLEKWPKSNRLESLEKLTKTSENIENSFNMLCDIKALELEVNQYYELCNNCVKKLEKYENIQKSIDSEKLSLKKLF